MLALCPSQTDFYHDCEKNNVWICHFKLNWIQRRKEGNTKGNNFKWFHESNYMWHRVYVPLNYYWMWSDYWKSSWHYELWSLNNIKIKLSFVWDSFKETNNVYNSCCTTDICGFKKQIEGIEKLLCVLLEYYYLSIGKLGLVTSIRIVGLNKSDMITSTD